MYPKTIVEPNSVDWSHIIYVDKTDLVEPSVLLTNIIGDIKLGSRERLQKDMSECDSEIKGSKFYNLIVFAALIATQIGIGFCFVKRYAFNVYEYSFGWGVGLSYLIGNVVFNVPLWIMYCIGIPYNLNSVTFIWGILIIFLLFEFYNFNRSPRFVNSNFLPVNCNRGLFAYVAFITLYFVIFYTLVNTNLIPLDGWDTLGHWAGPAKRLMYESKVTISEYPMLWVYTLSPMYALSSVLSEDGHVKWVLSVMIVAFVGQCIGILKLLNVKKTVAYLSTALFFIWFGRNWVYTEAQADLPLIAYLMAFISLCLLCIKRPNQLQNLKFLLWVIGVGLVTIKLEGFVYLLFASFAYVIASFRKPLHSLSIKSLLVLILPVLSLLVWIVYLSHIGGLENKSQFSNLFNWNDSVLSKLLAIVKLAPKNIENESFAFCTVCFIAAFIYLTFFRKGLSSHSLMLAILYMASYLFVYVSFMGWTLDNIINGWSVAFPRLVAHAEPIAFVFLMSLLYLRGAKYNNLESSESDLDKPNAK